MTRFVFALVLLLPLAASAGLLQLPTGGGGAKPPGCTGPYTLGSTGPYTLGSTGPYTIGGSSC
jgi:hypothetical protein